MIRLSETRSSAARRGVVTTVGRSLHLHRYTWCGDDPFSGSSLYRCRCGVVRPAV